MDFESAYLEMCKMVDKERNKNAYIVAGFINMYNRNKNIHYVLRYKTNMRNTSINLSSIITLLGGFHGNKFALNLFG